jgi:outer membrane protein OmpA-like peptidoglycan-associated protein
MIYFLAEKLKRNGEEPFNIGYPINSTNDESGFVVSTDGQFAYFSSNNIEGVGGHDIFGFELPENAKPHKVLFIKGKLIDGKGAMINNADIEIKNMNTNEINTALLDQNTGKYTIALSAKENDNYIMTVKKQNYSFASKIISPSEDTSKEMFNMELNFAINELNVGAKTRLNNILFSTNSAELGPLSTAMLDNFAEYLQENPNIKIRVEGHTDNIADSNFNLKLSKKRAHKVYRYLIKKGVKRGRMIYEGYGETQPIVDNDTEENRAKNRRTEFVITALE